MKQSWYYFKRGDAWYHTGNSYPNIDDYTQSSHIIDIRLGVIIENPNSSDGPVIASKISDVMTDAELTAIILSSSDVYK